MIRFLSGDIIAINRNQIVIATTCGVGYGVIVTSKLVLGLASGQHVGLHISESIREDAHDLYGFSDLAERELFERVRRASGVGPKVALSIVGTFAPAELEALLEAGDAKQLSAVPGIGPKTAVKIIAELRVGGSLTTPAIDNSSYQQVIQIVRSLGYTDREISAAIKNLPHNLATDQERVMWLLRALGS